MLGLCNKADPNRKSLINIKYILLTINKEYYKILKEFKLIKKAKLLIIIILVSSDVMAFSKKPVDTKPNTEFMEISAEKKTCQGFIEQQCLMYKKLTFKNGKKIYENNEW